MKEKLDITGLTKIRMPDGKAYCMFGPKGMLIAVADLMKEYEVMDNDQPGGVPKP